MTRTLSTRIFRPGKTRRIENTSCSKLDSIQSIKDDTHKWHFCLGSIPFSRMKVISKLDSEVVTTFDLNPYSICYYAKQTYLSFPISTTNTMECFQIVHMDIWGPMKVATI